MDYIKETLLLLPEKERTLAMKALNIASQSGQSWKVRYKLSNDALILLGAKKRKGDKVSETFYIMPCGCIYRLYYAEPICEKYCNKHFPQKEQISSLLEIIIDYAKNVLIPVIFIGSVIATIASGVSIIFGDGNDFLIFMIYSLLTIFSYLVIAKSNN